MRRTAATLALVTFAASFAGCLQPEVEEQASFTLNRQVRFEVNGENVDAARAAERRGETPDPYLFVTSSFVITARESGASPADLVLTYQDRSGATLTKPLSEFTSQETLEPGDVVRVDNANLTSQALLTHKGETIADRARSPVDWWVMGGYPIGYAMAPGSSIAYDVASGASEKFTIEDLRPKDEDVTIDAAEASFAFNYDAAVSLAYAEAPEPKEGQQGRPLSWTLSGKLSTPMLFSLRGSDASTGDSVDAGFEVLPESGVSMDANGKIWLNGSRAPYYAAVEGGSTETKADAIAWLTGTDLEAAANFSCQGKTREDACRPTELGLDELASSETIEPQSEPIDVPWDVDAEALEQISAFLLEDLRVGDEILFHLDLDQDDVDDEHADDGSPQTYHVVVDAEVRAQSEEQVPIAGRTFDAIKVAERVSARVEMGPIVEDGKTVFNGLLVDQKFIDVTMWLAKDSFVPLRIEQTIPVDLGALVGDLFDSMGPEAWDAAGIEPIPAENLEWTTETRMSLSLTKLEGDVQHSPWLVLGGFNGLWTGAPFMLAMGSMGGFAHPAYPAYPEFPAEPSVDGMCYAPEDGSIPEEPCLDAYGDEPYWHEDPYAYDESYGTGAQCYSYDENGNEVATPCPEYAWNETDAPE